MMLLSDVCGLAFKEAFYPALIKSFQFKVVFAL